MMRFNLKDPGETVTLRFDLSGVTDAPSNVEVVVSHAAGDADANPSAILDGDPQIDGVGVLQRVKGGVLGATYLLRCWTDAPGGQRVVVSGLLPVRLA